MAYVTTSPTVITQVNWYLFENAHVLTRQQQIVLDCRRGYKDGNGHVTEVDLVSCTVSGDAYGATLQTAIANGATLGEAVIAAAYTLLIAAGIIPAGATAQ